MKYCVNVQFPLIEAGSVEKKIENIETIIFFCKQMYVESLLGTLLFHFCSSDTKAVL